VASTPLILVAAEGLTYPEISQHPARTGTALISLWRQRFTDSELNSEPTELIVATCGATLAMSRTSVRLRGQPNREPLISMCSTIAQV
jgi:hypothetical protein